MTRPWDYGIEWRSNLVTPGVGPIVTLAQLRDNVLRAVTGGVENDHILSLLNAATDMAEEATQRALLPQTWEMVLSGFPTGPIILPRPPLISITSFAYLDADGSEQTLAASPAEYRLIPSGRYKKAELTPLYGENWPSTSGQTGPVTITYRAGFEDFAVQPAPMIIRGIELAVSEMYDVRKLSVHGTNTSVPAQLQLEQFWRMVH